MIDRIRQIMDDTLTRGTGLLGLGFYDLESGGSYYVNGDALFPTASVYKIFVLCELLRELKEGMLSPDMRIVLRDADKKGGSGILREVPEGTEYTLAQYIDLMMQISDNTATDYLVRLVGKESIYKNVIRPMGLKETTIDLACEGLLAKYYANPDGYYPDPKTGKSLGNYRNNSYFACREPRNNVSTPREMVLTMRLLYEGRVIDPETDKKVLDEMATCQTNSRIPALLPPGTRIAHKTGSLDHLANDTGIVYTPKGNYILSCFYNGNLADEKEYLSTSWSEKGTGILAQLSKDIYDAYTA